MNNKEKLRECPFCGGKAKIHTVSRTGKYGYVRCTKCGVQTPVLVAGKEITQQKSVSNWNRRSFMNSLLNLKNCPMCGGKALMVTYPQESACQEGYMRQIWSVMCSDCGLETPDNTDEEAANHWNNRYIGDKEKCPFCGGLVKFFTFQATEEHPAYAKAVCFRCAVESPNFQTEKDLQEYWYKRCLSQDCVHQEVSNE